MTFKALKPGMFSHVTQDWWRVIRTLKGRHTESVKCHTFRPSDWRNTWSAKHPVGENTVGETSSQWKYGWWNIQSVKHPVCETSDRKNILSVNHPVGETSGRWNIQLAKHLVGETSSWWNNRLMNHLVDEMPPHLIDTKSFKNIFEPVYIRPSR